MKGVPRIRIGEACGVLIDVQEFFLAELAAGVRKGVEDSAAKFLKLCAWLKLPVLATVERPIDQKGSLPSALASLVPGLQILEKDFFDLTKHDEIEAAVKALGRRQVIVGGCETDVCVLQSCLGLLELGYEVFLVDELLFSSSDDVKDARHRLRDAGCVFVSQKTLFYELVEAIERGPHRQALVEKYGAMPGDLF